MVSWTDVWDPFHAGALLSQLNEQWLAGPAPFCDVTLVAADEAKFFAHQSILAACSPHFRQLLSSSTLALLKKDRVLELPHLQSRVLSNLLDYIYTSRVSTVCSTGTTWLCEAGRSLGVPFLAGLKVEESNHMKSKSGQDRIEGMEETDKAGAAKSAKTPLCFPLGMVFPSLAATEKHCPSSLSPRSPACLMGSEEPPWKMATSIGNQLHHLQNKPVTSLSPSSSSPIDLTAPARKDSLSSPTSATVSSASQFQNLPLQSHQSGPLLVYPKKATGESFPAGLDSEHLTTETAQILFNMSTAAFHGRRPTEPEQSSRGKPGRLDSPPRGSGLPHPSSLPPTLSPPPPHGSCQTVPKPELLCGVCHRLFSSASALTVHMRLHRSGRALSCRHCGKAFIHNKRLQSHEAACRQAPHILPVQTKQEPLEEGDDEGERVGAMEDQPEQGHALPGRPPKKGRGFLRQHSRGFPQADLLGEEDHFVKVVDGHIIYFCAVCERSYMTLSSLKRHSNVHSWRRKYPCRYCDKVFALAEYRTKHEVWHTGERRYQCIFCWEAFATYYNLKTHQKALHGISPGLISSEKTANGGYKQKVNALKLYRLLPMRSQKRPYKTYSQSLADSLMLPPDPTVPLPLPLDCSLTSALGPSELHSLTGDGHPQGIQHGPTNFPFGVSNVGLDQGEASKLASALLDTPMRVNESETAKKEPIGSSTLRLPKGNGDSKVGLSSVITYGHPKPSVIVHGTAVSSSVIVHSNQITARVDRSCHDGSSPETTRSELSPKAKHQPLKKHMLKEYIRAQRQASWQGEGITVTDEPGNAEETVGEEKARPQKGRKLHNKSITYMAKPACMAGVSEVKGIAPLCQITVRIGEEAIVKRSISETDLMRDKSSPLPNKPKKTDSTLQEITEAQHTHHHHHRHRHRPHRDPSEQAEGDIRRKNSKSPKAHGKVRQYYFRQEVREEDSDQDTEDNLWRPYYSYKPKRKALHVQKVKKTSWQRKLRYKHSLRLMRRAEKLMGHNHKEEDEGQEEEAEEGEELEEEGGENEGKEAEGLAEEHSTESTHRNSTPSKQQQGQDTKEETSLFGLSSPQSPLQPLLDAPFPLSTRQETHHLTDQSPECGTCGRRFSTPRKRDKHELTHLLEFVCLLCRESFSTQTRLEKHQRTQHAPSQPSPMLKSQPPDLDLETEQKLDRERLGLGKGSPGRVGRRPSIRHTCPHCSKVCKTAAALGRHVKRHESGSSVADKEAEGAVLHSHKEVSFPGIVLPELSTDSDVKSALVKSIPVISYPVLTPQSNGSCESQGPSLEHVGKVEAEHKAFEIGITSVGRNEGFSAKNNHSHQEPPFSATTMSSSPHSVLVLSSKESKDKTSSFKTLRDTSPGEKGSQKNSPAPKSEAGERSPGMALKLQTRPNSAATVPITMGASGRGSVAATDAANHEEGCTPSRGVKRSHSESEDSTIPQDLRATALCKSPSARQAQDLSMPSFVGRERDLSQQAKPNGAKEQREMVLLVPKQEVETPEYCAAQTTASCTPQKLSKSPCCSPHGTDLLARAQLESIPTPRGAQGHERPQILQPPSSSRANDRPSAHALLLPRAPPPEPKPEESSTTASHGDMGYPVQEFPLPLIVPGGCRSSKKHEDNILVSYPASPIPFGPLGKIGANGELAKLPFYPDPYQLLYGPQLLPYPYNLAALPMALNMMAPGDKVEPLPFLPALFNYGAGPYVGTAPHPLVANPGHYNSSSSSGKKRDSNNP
ncbi:zinc finger and BTB domain-containing protein 38 [Scleropages formosus]|uniref:zinc finger and BTB domain-containing protein 38 n=1 Tax=Scleropages formosus TaxID=113540 RepID=UPI0008780E2E|nr:zinc finger and BTB domain-containing protein 4 [Scleropages formosus]